MNIIYLLLMLLIKYEYIIIYCNIFKIYGSLGT